MRRNIKIQFVVCLVVGLLFFSSGYPVLAADAQEQVTSPEEYFGFQLGSDRNIARWDKIVAYFQVLGKQSDKLKVIDMGPSTMGNPFLLVIISSPNNLANLERLQRVNSKLSDPRGVAETEIKNLVKEGKK